MEVSKIALAGQEIRINGTCTGVIPSGAELSEQVYFSMDSREIGQHIKAARPIRGNQYTLNGCTVVCQKSAFRQGNEYVMDCWTFVLKNQ